MRTGERGLTLLVAAADSARMDAREPVTLVLGRFEDLIGRGLRSLIGDDDNIELLAADVDLDALGATLGEHEPRETIRTHRRNIYRKLGVRTRRELASLTQS